MVIGSKQTGSDPLQTKLARPILTGAFGTAVALACTLSVSGCGTAATETSTATEVESTVEGDWPATELTDLLPTPTAGTVKIDFCSSETLVAQVDDVSKEEYAAYAEACAEAGFSVDAGENPLGYEAANEDGYHLQLIYFESLQNMSITLSAES